MSTTCGGSGLFTVLCMQQHNSQNCIHTVNTHICKPVTDTAPDYLGFFFCIEKKYIGFDIVSRARSWDGDGHSQKLQIATVTKCFEQEENPYNLGKSAAKAKEATQSDSVPQQQDTQHHLAIPLHTSEASGFVGAFVRKSFTPLHTSTTLTDGVCCTSLHKRVRARQSEGEKAKGQTVPNPLQKRNPCRKNKKKNLQSNRITQLLTKKPSRMRVPL